MSGSTSAEAGRPAWSGLLPRYLGRFAFVLVSTAVLNFCILKLVPGDLVDVIAAENGSVTPEYLAQLRAAYGLDQSFGAQLGHYLARLAQLDLGQSHRFGEPVLQVVLDRVGATVALVGTGLACALLLGVLLGCICARRPGGLLDNAVTAVASLGHAAPVFWTALMLIVLFGVHLDWLPVGGFEDVGAGHQGLRLWLDRAEHMVLPALTIALYYLAVYTRLTRAAMIDALQEDYARTAKAWGHSEWQVIRSHALRNAIMPVLTMLGIQASALLGGSVVVETVFAWPGLGQLAYEAISSRDINLLAGILLFGAALVVTLNILVDLVQHLLDPRTRAPVAL